MRDVLLALIPEEFRFAFHGAPVDSSPNAEFAMTRTGHRTDDLILAGYRLAFDSQRKKLWMAPKKSSRS